MFMKVKFLSKNWVRKTLTFSRVTQTCIVQPVTLFYKVQGCYEAFPKIS